MGSKQFAAAVAAAAVILSTIFVPSARADDGTIIVTATRTARTADATLAPVTVITRKQIEQSQASSVAELLRGTAGIDLSNTGGWGKATSLYLRGTNSSHVLVLVDGVRVGSATLGTTPFALLPVDQIERIEIVRGPRSSLYGSEAIGGVIQIFTRRGREGLHLNAAGGGGSFGTRHASAGISGGSGGSHFSLEGSHFATDGINAMVNNNPDRDGYHNNSASLNLGRNFASGGAFDLDLMHAEGLNRYDNAYDPSSAYDNGFVEQVAAARLRLPLSDWWDLSLRAGSSIDDEVDHTNGVRSSRFRTIRDQFSWQNDFPFGTRQMLSVGLDLLRDTVSSTTSYASNSRDNKGLFASWQGGFGPADFQLGLRQDDNQAFGGHTTGNLDLGLALGAGLRAIASYGTAFKAPTFNDLYYPGYGNPELKPESSHSAELGLRGSHGWGRWGLALYRTDIDDLIDAVCDSSWNCAAQNVNRARIDGFEASLDISRQTWSLRTALTLLNPRNRDSGKLLARRSTESFRLDLDRRWGRLASGLGVVVQGRRYDDSANTRPLGAYTLVNLHADLTLGRGLSLAGHVDNLLDEDYRTASDYNSPGRGYFLSLRYAYDSR